ncbi:MAG: recombination mediator RecR [Crocinitomicaceae bacterium]
MQIPSKNLENVVNQLGTLPGVGRRTALRLALFLLKKSDTEISDFTESILNLHTKIHFCKNCHNISDNEICDICSNSTRDASTICIVEDIRDVMAIEATGTYKGVYHILGGLISPMDGIGPGQLTIQSLVNKAENTQPKEIIFALSPTMEGDTTNFYLYKKLQHVPVLITALSRGVSVGTELQYADELTLSRSLEQRSEFKAV